MSTPDQPPSGAAPALPAGGEVHVWHIAVADVTDDTDAVASVLTESERARAARFAFPHLARRFVCGRAALRRILASYLSTEAPLLTFGTGPRGKPFLISREGGASPLEFNMSDSGGHVLLAVTHGRAVGIDIEAIREVADADEIVERNFSAFERAAYRRLAPERRRLGFFCAWTRKEAYMKAVGLGFYLPLDSFSVAIDPDEPARLVEVDGDPVKAAEWTLRPVVVPDGHVGALVARGQVEAVRTRRWSAG